MTAAVTLPKQILAPGRYWVADRDSGEPYPVDFSADDCRAFCASGNGMLARGYAAPIPLEHQDDAGPLTAAEMLARSVSHNTGRAARYWIDPSDNSLWADLEIHWLPDTPPDQIEEALKSRVKFVSPDLHPSLALGDGSTWKHAIRHIALTPTPIFLGQKPFGEGPAAMSQGRPAVGWAGFGRPARLSLADRVALSQFDESQHPRGQPGNAGEFAPKSGATGAAEPTEAMARHRQRVVRESQQEGTRLNVLGEQGQKVHLDPVAVAPDEEVRRRWLENKPLPLPHGGDAEVQRRLGPAWDEVSRLWPEMAGQLKTARMATPEEAQHLRQATAALNTRTGELVIPPNTAAVPPEILWHELVHLDQLKRGELGRAPMRDRNGMTEHGRRMESEAHQRGNMQAAELLGRLRGDRGGKAPPAEPAPAAPRGWGSLSQGASAGPLYHGPSPALPQPAARLSQAGTGAKPMAPEPKKDDETPHEQPATDAAAENEDDALFAGKDKPAEEPAPAPQEGWRRCAAELSAELKDMGMVLPADTDSPEEWCEHCLTSVRTHKATKALADEAPPAPPPDEAPPEKTPEEDPAVAQARPEPEVVSMSMLAAARGETAELRAELGRERALKVQERIARLEKAGYAPAKAKALRETFAEPGVQMSLASAKGREQSVKVGAALARLEEAEDAFADRIKMSLAREEAVPAHARWDDSAEAKQRQEEAGDTLISLAGIAKKK